MAATDIKKKADLGIQAENPAETLERLRRCIDLMERAYGLPKRRGSNPVDLLVQTILSQNTTSANTHRAFENLKRRYPDYQALLDAPDEEVARAIRCGGLANIKTKRIKEALEKIKERGEGTGSIDLDFLKDADPEVARDRLMDLPGVGPKTAAVVLLFAFNMPLLPVDTHVNRLSRRLGFVPVEASLEEAERILEMITPRDKYCSFHVNLIRHGRAVCSARAPFCDGCILREVCPYPDLAGQKG
ncbi:MAG: endonuclease III [Methanothrix harundinacea]|uniref:HhH-GPD family protein n=1 Tax=Methanothrix harundinacea TaxID=301375 RepID=A0A101FUP6_9EURY|nr:MAG: HhH-GPD family protein [Methanothrix harundinacea]KUK96395.1 MAG: HhH-GPD family protein [Methanothrix harundinacea]MCP1391762.1 endonuclease III [Methanothrix harundinacea]